MDCAICLLAFSFDAEGAKEKAWRKENAASVGAAHTRHLLKKVDENFKCAPRVRKLHSALCAYTLKKRGNYYADV